jgi:uncharacterized protein
MNDKASRYNIEVEYANGMLLYNALTNKLLTISFKDYAVIETLMEHLPEFINKFPDLYAAFKKSGFIVDFDELAYIKLQNKRCIYAHQDYHITINPTLDCNLKCWYCSVGYAGAKHNRERMSDETLSRLNKHIYDLVAQQKAHSVLLDWFGGEPMMYYDDVICKVSESALQIASDQKVNFRQHITTNATLLNEKRIREMKDSNFSFFQIPIDGNEHRHNQIKYYPDKRGTYKDVFNNINLIADIIPNVSIALRINYDKQTLKNIKDILSDLSEKSKRCITVDFQRIWQVPCTDKERQLLQAAKEEFQAAGFRSNFWAYKPLNFHRCYADKYRYYAINYNGKVFKCTARDYGDDMVIGNLQLSGKIAWKDGILSKLFEKATFENDMCENCNMLPLCMGPCIQTNYEARKHNKPLECLYKNVEYSLSAYVIEMAKRKNLIK